VDGKRSVGDIAQVLSAQYNGAGGADPTEILNDVTAYLSTLAARELIRDQ
jgi:hypothetical protein